MKSIIAFALGALAGIFGFQKHQEVINGKKFDSKSTRNAAIEITKEGVNDAETNAAESARRRQKRKSKRKRSERKFSASFPPDTRPHDSRGSRSL